MLYQQEELNKKLYESIAFFSISMELRFLIKAYDLPNVFKMKAIYDLEELHGVVKYMAGCSYQDGKEYFELKILYRATSDAMRAGDYIDHLEWVRESRQGYEALNAYEKEILPYTLGYDKAHEAALEMEYNEEAAKLFMELYDQITPSQALSIVKDS